MKKTYVCLAIVFIIGCSNPDSSKTTELENDLLKAVDKDRLQQRGKFDEKLFYAPNQEIPFSGTAKKLWSSGQVMELVNIKDGLLEGLSTKWHQNGQKKEEAYYKGGLIEGLAYKWYENGQPFGQGYFKKGIQHGSTKLWHENGQKKREAIYHNGDVDGLETEWYENGQKKSEINFKGGLKQGLAKEWYLNGQSRLNAEYKADKLNGSVVKFSSDGEMLEEASYNMGKLTDGYIAEFHKNGQKKSVTHYKNGTKDGIEVTWYNNGQKKLETLYESGQKNGQSTEWSEEGKKKEILIWKNGVAVKKTANFGLLSAPQLENYDYVEFTKLTNFEYDVSLANGGNSFNEKEFSKRVPSSVRALTGQRIAIDGFMIPTVFGENKTVKEFILMPDQSSRLLNYKPKSNGWIVVSSDQGLKPETNRLIRVIGSFNVEEKWDAEFFEGLYHLKLQDYEISKDP